MIIIFLISLYLCIILHELAHLIAAKAVKCKVEVFSIGFGKAIYKTKIGNTIYQFSWIPFGGYNKLKDECIMSTDKNAFTNLKYRNKMIIISAGCLINIVTGLIALFFAKLSFQTNPLIIYYENVNLFYFGYISLLLGIGNFIPFPALDGFYPYGVWLEKLLGKEKGYKLMGKLNYIGFVFLMILNVLSILFMIYLYRELIINHIRLLLEFIHF